MIRAQEEKRRPRGFDRLVGPRSDSGSIDCSGQQTQLRVLILSAAVGDGHDTAARGVAEELRSLGLEPVIENGLRLLGRRLEWLVVDGYHAQLTHARWSWRLLYRATRSRLLIGSIGSLLALVAGRRLLRRIDAEQAQLVVSTYPLVSAALAALRRSGRLSVACAAIVTDVDPHPAWTHAHLDANFSVAATRLGVVISPPVPSRPEPRRAASVILGLVGAPPGARVALIVGGAWGVGDLEGAARAATAAGLHAIVVCGRNPALRDRLRARSDLAGVAVLGYTRLMPELMSIADVVIQNAGGLTCLEAFRANVPVVFCRPLQGHGVANARRMRALGLIRIAATTAELTCLLRDESYWLRDAPETCARAATLYDAPTCGALLATLADRRSQPIRRRRSGRQMRVVTSVIVAVMAFALADAHALAAVERRNSFEIGASIKRTASVPSRQTHHACTASIGFDAYDAARGPRSSEAVGAAAAATRGARRRSEAGLSSGLGRRSSLRHAGGSLRQHGDGNLPRIDRAALRCRRGRPGRVLLGMAGAAALSRAVVVLDLVVRARAERLHRPRPPFGKQTKARAR